MKKLLILAIACFMVSCGMEPSPEYLKFEKARRARIDAENLQKYRHQPFCTEIYSKEWTKVIYDEKEGYCIARTLKNYLEYHCNNTPSFKDKLSCKDIKKSK